MCMHASTALLELRVYLYTGICMRAYPTWKSQFITSTGKVFSKVSFTVLCENHLRGNLVVSYWKRD